MQQREVYDRRTSQEKAVNGVKLTASIAERALGINSCTSTDLDASDYVPERDDIVALVEEGSTHAKPLIILGKVLRVYQKDREVLLAHLKPVKVRNKYQLDAGQDTWKENFDALIYPIDIHYEPKSGVYILRTPPSQIHQVVKT